MEIDPILNEPVYSYQEQLASVVERYKQLNEQRIYLASEIQRLAPLADKERKNE